MALWYPSMVCHFRVRFDEAYSYSKTVPTSTAEFDPNRIDIPPPQTAQEAASNRGSSGQASTSKIPTLIDGSADSLTQVDNVVPRSANVELSGFRQAGKFSLTMPFRDFPIDPRLVRSCAVEIHLGSIPAADFGAGMTGQKYRGMLKSILAARGRVFGPNEDTLLMAGLVDNWYLSHGAKSSEVKLDGRDLRAIFLDSPVDPKLFSKLNLNQTIDRVVADILEKHPLGGNFRGMVEINEFEWKKGVPIVAVKGDLTRVRQAAKGGGQKSQPAGDTSKLSYWDLITRYCFLVGALPYLEGYTLHIRPVRSVFDTALRAGIDPNYPASFAGGAAREVQTSKGKTETLHIRRLVYGRELEEVSFERKFTGKKASVIECVSINTDVPTKGRRADGTPNQLITAQWPPKSKPKARTTGVAPSGKASGTEVIRVPVPGVTSTARLQDIARAIYEEVGRGEMGGSASTKALSSFGGDNEDPDLLRLRPGDPVELAVDSRALSSRSPLIAELVDHERRSLEEEVSAIAKRLNGDTTLARVIVSTARGAVRELQRPFRVHTVKYDWSANGIGISFDFQNYIEARSDAG